MKKTNLKEGICVLFEGIPDENEIAAVEKRYNQITRTSVILFIVSIACISVAVATFMNLLFGKDRPLYLCKWLSVLLLFVFILGVILLATTIMRSAQRVEQPMLNRTLHIYCACSRLREFEAEFSNVQSSFSFQKEPISVSSLDDTTVCIKLSGETKEGDIVEREVYFPVKSYSYNTKISLPVVDAVNGSVRIPENMKMDDSGK